MAEFLELDDMQRLILEGYQGLPFSRYALLTIQKGSAAQARAWLASVIADDRIGTANERGRIARYQLAIAFTHAGLEAIGLDSAKGFLAPFRQGMITPARSADLGDTGNSDPKEWIWGHGIHMLLMLYSGSAEKRGIDWKAVDRGLDWADRSRLRLLDGFIHREKEEHFGFRDGISQPYIEGSDTSRALRQKISVFDSVKPGEFILGYRNEANAFPTSPYIPADRYDEPADEKNRLPARVTDSERIDFGRNGTYLVLRQLRQEVEQFKKYLELQAPGTSAEAKAARELIKAKMVGRWPSGAPLVKAPAADKPVLATDNDFGFHESDRYGHACPVGSHIRRSNPRDSLVDELRGIGPEEALRRSRRHRLIRRGRLYDSTGSEDVEEARAGKGVLFICLNANIQDQFEFVQHNWVNAPTFGGLEGETDPLVGPRSDSGGHCPMTIPGAHGTRRLHGLPRFVDAIGGAYFFMPGMRALRYLTADPQSSASTRDWSSGSPSSA